jgi:hypothetical protein
MVTCVQHADHASPDHVSTMHTCALEHTQTDSLPEVVIPLKRLLGEHERLQHVDVGLVGSCPLLLLLLGPRLLHQLLLLLALGCIGAAPPLAALPAVGIVCCRCRLMCCWCCCCCWLLLRSMEARRSVAACLYQCCSTSEASLLSRFSAPRTRCGTARGKCSSPATAHVHTVTAMCCTSASSPNFPNKAQPHSLLRLLICATQS